jgi:hypothetical protein
MRLNVFKSQSFDDVPPPLFVNSLDTYKLGPNTGEITLVEEEAQTI